VAVDETTGRVFVAGTDDDQLQLIDPGTPGTPASLHVGGVERGIEVTGCRDGSRERLRPSPRCPGRHPKCPVSRLAR
jgi:hypothetical protein